MLVFNPFPCEAAASVPSLSIKSNITFMPCRQNPQLPGSMRLIRHQLNTIDSALVIIELSNTLSEFVGSTAGEFTQPDAGNPLTGYSVIEGIEPEFAQQTISTTQLFVP